MSPTRGHVYRSLSGSVQEEVLNRRCEQGQQLPGHEQSTELQLGTVTRDKGVGGTRLLHREERGDAD